MDLEMLLVQECIAVYEDEKKTYNEDKWLDGLSFPERLIITEREEERSDEETEEAEEAEGEKQEAVKAWEYKDGVLTEIPPEPVQVDLFGKGFFPAALIDFYWDHEKKTAYIDACYAPLYGEGTTREILHEGEKVKLGRAGFIWVS